MMITVISVIVDDVNRLASISEQASSYHINKDDQGLWRVWRGNHILAPLACWIKDP